MSASRVSVIVPTYHRAELLGHTLASLTRQTLPVDHFEVLVCDDGSTDDAAAVVDRFRDRLDITRLFHEHDGFGASRSRNDGITQATGDVCVLLDSGALAHSNCLAAHLDNHAAEDGPYAVIGYVYGYSVDEDDLTGIERQIDVDDVDATVERMAAKELYPDIRDEFYLRYHDDFTDLPAPWVMFWTANVSVPTALLRHAGMFDEQFRRWGGEDLDIAFRLLESGARFVINRAACSVEYPHPRNFEAGLEMSRTNHRLLIPKYDSPVVPLLMALPTINPFNINDFIEALGLDTTPGRAWSAREDLLYIGSFR